MELDPIDCATTIPWLSVTLTDWAVVWVFLCTEAGTV